MKATATDLARETAEILSHTQAGRTIQIQRRGKTIAVLRKSPGVSGKRLARALKKSPLTAQDCAALKAAIEEGKKALRNP